MAERERWHYSVAEHITMNEGSFRMLGFPVEWVRILREATPEVLERLFSDESPETNALLGQFRAVFEHRRKFPWLGERGKIEGVANGLAYAVESAITDWGTVNPQKDEKIPELPLTPDFRARLIRVIPGVVVPGTDVYVLTAARIKREGKGEMVPAATLENWFTKGIQNYICDWKRTQLCGA